MGRGAYAPHERWRLDRAGLAYAMRRAGVTTCAALSRRSGVGEKVVDNLVVGRTACPSAATLCSLAVALGCDALDLMEEVSQ